MHSSTPPNCSCPTCGSTWVHWPSHTRSMRRCAFFRHAACAGDMAVSEPPPGTNGWRIELAPLDVTNAPKAEFVLLRNLALATSGDLFQHVEINGVRYSHIVDPRTGVG